MRIRLADGREEERLLDIFPWLISGSHVVSAVGAGGKTTFLWRLAGELTAAGKRVIVTTTTHMAWEEERPWAEIQRGKNAAEEGNSCISVSAQKLLREKINEWGYVFTGKRETTGEKISNPFPEDACCRWVTELTELADVVLVEADGSRRLPLKVPGKNEPVIPPATDLVVGVAGLSSLGELPEERCHRWELWDFQEQRITGRDLERLAVSLRGLRKGVDPGMKYFVLLNQADDERRLEAGMDVCRRLARRQIACGTARLQDRLGVILLAAGQGSRFGENKLLYPVEGIPMGKRALELLAELPAQKRAVVTCYEKMENWVGSLGISCVKNPHPELGISSSLRLGLGACTEMDGWLFMVADQPRLSLESVKRLIRCWQESPRGIAALSCGKQIGNPVIFSRRYRGQLLELRGDRGGKRVLNSHREDTLLVEVQPWELEDLDRKPES